MRVVFKDIHKIRRRLADGTVKEYLYHRATKKRLPDDPTSPEFAIAYKKITHPNVRVPGTMDALIAQFRASRHYLNLKDSTRADYARYFQWFEDKHGDKPVCMINREAVLVIQETLSGTPRRADLTVRVLSILLGYALDRPSSYGLNSNPARGIKPINRTVGYKPWPDDLLSAFKLKAYPGLWNAVLMALYTGQRAGDCIKMTWDRFDGSAIEVTQEKTGEHLWIPCHRVLKGVLNALVRPKELDTPILTNRRGKPWTKSFLSHEVTKAVKGLGGGYVFHGLRYNAAQKLAEVGCSEKEIASITGHRTSAMIQKYSRGANQRKLALAAMEKWEGDG